MKSTNDIYKMYIENVRQEIREGKREVVNRPKKKTKEKSIKDLHLPPEDRSDVNDILIFFGYTINSKSIIYKDCGYLEVYTIPDYDYLVEEFKILNYDMNEVRIYEIVSGRMYTFSIYSEGYVVKKNGTNKYIKSWGSNTPTYINFHKYETGVYSKEIYTEDINEAKVYKSKGGAKSSLRQYINLFRHTIIKLKLNT